MLQPETFLQTQAFVPTRLSICAESTSAEDRCPEAQQPLPSEMLDLFEQLTGWVIEFQESKTSFRNRQLPSMIEQVAEGSLSIVDMSAAWPPRKPTAHRAKCDQFVGFLESLVTELQETKARLAKTQSILEAHVPGSVEDEDAMLVDSFVPRYDDVDLDDCLDPDDDFEFVDELNREEDVGELNDGPIREESVRAVDPPFDGWHFSGAPGIVDGRYVDWNLSSDERINLVIGQIETLESPVEGEAVLTVDPLTNEYMLSGDEGFDFFIFDQKNQHISSVEATNQFRQLKSSQLVIVSTSWSLSSFVADIDFKLEGSLDQIANDLRELVGEEEQVLVLGRSKS